MLILARDKLEIEKLNTVLKKGYRGRNDFMEGKTPLIDDSTFTELEEIMEDGEGMLELIDSFLEDGAVLVNNIAESYQKNNVEEFQRQAHTLKGSSANLGLTALWELCKMLDRAGKAGNLPAASQMEQLQQIYQNTVSVLKQKRSEYASEISD